MNERIRELAEQAGTYFGGGTTDYFGDYLPPYVSITDLDLEKFAELIVREFVSIVEEEIKLVEEFKSTAVKADVIKCHTSKIYHFHKLIDKSKKHFGVEE
jgi:hypothetical protein